MGNNLQSPRNSIDDNNDIINITSSRFMQSNCCFEPSSKSSVRVEIPEFKRCQDWEVELEQLKPPEEPNSNVLTSQVFFPEKQSLDLYMSTLLSLKQLCGISIYSQLQVKIEQNPLQLVTKQSASDKLQPIQKSHFFGPNINKFLDLLIFISQKTAHTKNMFIPPEEIYCCNGEFLLRSFYHKSHNKFKLIRTYIAWLYQEFESFNDLFENQHIISFIEIDIYLREIFLALKSDKIKQQCLTLYLSRVKDKYNYLNFNFDSFQACFRSKRARNNAFVCSEWLLAKIANEVNFFNIRDKHLCQGRIIRKKNKIMVEQTHAIFNGEQLQLNFMLEGTKNIVKASQFELQDCFSISDIEIKHKFPFKMKNPMIFLRGRQIYMYDQMIYKYAMDQNKLYQESKKINDGIFLASSIEFNYLIIRLSIDIFRHGIRLYYNDKYETIYPSGNPSMANQIQHIKIDLKHIDFCLEAYKGVYLLLANHNLWIIDLNFSCFFSYAPIQRVKDYFKNKNNLQEEDDFAFQIMDQPFAAKWIPHQDNLNVTLDGDNLHVIASVMGKLFYMNYQFILEAGMLRLKSYQPLFNQQPKIGQIIQQIQPQRKQFSFNIYSQHFDFFKTNKWIYEGPSFLQVFDLKACFNKNCTEVVLSTEQVLTNLKQLIDEVKSTNQKWSKFQLSMLLHSITAIYNEINKNNISHKHFSISNLWITSKKKLKLVGWSQPHRNWYISDYRDYLLTCFNVITMNNSQKITDKLLEKHELELNEFSVLKDKMIQSLKHKLPEKKADQEKHLLNIRESLNKTLSPLFNSYKSNNCIFSFEFNTPRFSMLCISQNKIKKMIAVIEGGHSHEQFTFKTTDKFIWNEQEEQLFIFTTNYQMLEATINTKQLKEETIVLEEYQYLPQNIVDCSFIYTPKGIFAIGGLSRSSKKKILYNEQIYHFNQQKLTWLPVANIPNPRLQPKLILSSSGQHIYIMGGQLNCGPQCLEVLRFNISTHQIYSLIDFGYKNPFRSISAKQTHTIYQISEEQSIFVLWTANSTNFTFRIFSNLIFGFETELQGKIYLEQGGELPSVSIALIEGSIHFLRPYGKVTKIFFGALQNVTISHQTLYSN